MDHGNLESLRKVFRRNNEAARLMCEYLDKCPRYVTSSMMDEILSPYENSANRSILEKAAFVAMMASACGLDSEANPADRACEEMYFEPAVRKLDAALYRLNPYFANIKFPENGMIKYISRDSGRKTEWSLSHEVYEPYEAFICDGSSKFNDGRIVPSIGFFSERFEFPCVKENGREWMAVKPNEIETMKAPIACASGNVIAFGLGLGYFPYMAALKPDVKSVTIVERDLSVIELFKRYILPQFDNGGARVSEKIRVVKSDAFDFICNASANRTSVFDFAFVDLWHDALDGVPLYRRMKGLEYLWPVTKFSYWVENTLLDYIEFERVMNG